MFSVYRRLFAIRIGAVKILENQTYELLANSYAAIVTSGTATLETALFEVPEVVCYRGNIFSYILARILVKVKFISLVNLIMDKEIVKELIQSDFNAPNLKFELEKILSDEQCRTNMKNNFKELKNKLGGSGASKRTAELMMENLK